MKKYLTAICVAAVALALPAYGQGEAAKKAVDAVKDKAAEAVKGEKAEAVTYNVGMTGVT